MAKKRKQHGVLEMVPGGRIMVPGVEYTFGSCRLFFDGSQIGVEPPTYHSKHLGPYCQGSHGSSWLKVRVGSETRTAGGVFVLGWVLGFVGLAQGFFGFLCWSLVLFVSFFRVGLGQNAWVAFQGKQKEVVR